MAAKALSIRTIAVVFLLAVVAGVTQSLSQVPPGAPSFTPLKGRVEQDVVSDSGPYTADNIPKASEQEFLAILRRAEIWVQAQPTWIQAAGKPRLNAVKTAYAKLKQDGGWGASSPQARQLNAALADWANLGWQIKNTQPPDVALPSSVPSVPASISPPSTNVVDPALGKLLAQMLDDVSTPQNVKALANGDRTGADPGLLYFSGLSQGLADAFAEDARNLPRETVDALVSKLGVGWDKKLAEAYEANTKLRHFFDFMIDARKPLPPGADPYKVGYQRGRTMGSAYSYIMDFLRKY